MAEHEPGRDAKPDMGPGTPPAVGKVADRGSGRLPLLLAVGLAAVLAVVFTFTRAG